MQWDLFTGSTKLKQQLNESAGICVNSEVVFVVYPVSYKSLSCTQAVCQKSTPPWLSILMQLLLLHLQLAALTLCNLDSVCPFLMGFSQEDCLCPSKKSTLNYGHNGLLFLPKNYTHWANFILLNKGLWKLWLWIGGHFNYWTGILSRNIIEL